MLPLAYSLVALATVATVHAQSYCVTKEVGRKTDYKTSSYHEVLVTDFEIFIHLEAYCRVKGKRENAVGYKVKVCRSDPHGPLPMFNGPPPGMLIPIAAACPDHNGCVSYVNYYCKHPIF